LNLMRSVIALLSVLDGWSMSVFPWA